MNFEELKVGDKFIFDYDYDIDYDLEDEEQEFYRPLFMKTTNVKDKYYNCNATALTGKHKGKFNEVGKYESVIPIK